MIVGKQSTPAYLNTTRHCVTLGWHCHVASSSRRHELGQTSHSSTIDFMHGFVSFVTMYIANAVLECSHLNVERLDRWPSAAI